jgi:hypothetical protein
MVQRWSHRFYFETSSTTIQSEIGMDTDYQDTDITDLPGIGEKISTSLQARGYETPSDLITASVPELLRINGIGKTTLKNIKRKMEWGYGYEEVFEQSVFLQDTLTSEDDALKCEVDIVWIEDPREYEFVREWVRPSSTRQQPHSWKKDHQHVTTVGYGIAHPETPSNGRGQYLRRWLYIKPQDLDPVGAPIEGVAPKTVSVGQRGIDPEEAKNSNQSYSLSGKIWAD